MSFQQSLSGAETPSTLSSETSDKRDAADVAARHESMNQILCSHWLQVEGCILRGDLKTKPLTKLNGKNLDLAALIVSSRYGGFVDLSSGARTAIQESAEVVKQSIGSRDAIYGLNTGFGGNADTRTQATVHLQKDLLRFLQYGIVDDAEVAHASYKVYEQSTDGLLQGLVIPPISHGSGSAMPESWVRASMIVRLNSLAHGVSGVSIPTVDALQQLLVKNVIPHVPLRGSISASGDLSPLSYVAGVMHGKPSLQAWVEGSPLGYRTLQRADLALARNHLKPIEAKPKEGLALVNGTSVSAAVGSLAMHEALCLAGLCQVITAMSVEALQGSDESFDAAFAAVRPHWGQEESARAISKMLKGSKLTSIEANKREPVPFLALPPTLRQDRYAIRTAAQWIGPVLEDLNLAYKQVVTEINSATDNPLVDVQSSFEGAIKGRFVHGGNFQAKSITSAMEKVRLSVQSLGRLLFAQCTELINPATSNGLPPNLVCAEPSESFLFKGTDIMVAALVSELGFLANPVGSHVQTAEMGNQALNSLALISARYAIESLDILAQLASAHLVALCQALDLRAMHDQFITALEEPFTAMWWSEAWRGTQPSEEFELNCYRGQAWERLLAYLDAHTTLDSKTRIKNAVDSILPILLHLHFEESNARDYKSFVTKLTPVALRIYKATQAQYATEPDASHMLGEGAKRMYQFVRGRRNPDGSLYGLGVPFISQHTLDTPSIEDGNVWADKGLTLGELNGRVRRSMVSGEMYRIVVQCLSL